MELDLAISPSGFVFDPRTGATFSANPAARLLLEGMQEGEGLAALVARLQAHFEVGEADDLERDVLEFLRVLQDETLVPAERELEG
ncbi:MAG: PqqD family protein [Deltaproteobacteria bacterium]|nr:PqqD family protein [Deltaproteobacteria bacterium]